MKKWLLIALLCVAPLCAAPLPKKTVNKPVPAVKDAIYGYWDLEWGGTSWKMHLDKNGSYACIGTVTNDPWAGSYGYDPITNTLVVQEKRIEDEGNSYLTWTVTLDKDMKGTTQSGTAVHLTRPSK